MSFDTLAGTITEAIASIEGVSSRIEDTFTRAGNDLGRGHAIFKDLSGDLTALSREFSATEVEGASAALQNIAGRLNAFADALPEQSALLSDLGGGVKAAASLLQPVSKQVKRITIIARSARIEAASLEKDRDNFLAFTQEACELGKSVERLIEGCADDQELLTDAVETALKRQRDFERLYRDQLVSASAALIAAYSGMRDQQNKSVALADLAATKTTKIAEAVGLAIVSLQAGDSTRQRLEHVCQGLHLTAGNAPTLVPVGAEACDSAHSARLICRLEAAQLKDVEREFGRETGNISLSLKAVHGDAADIVVQGRSLYHGSGGKASSFLTDMKQTLARASALIATCERSGKSVDDALSVVEDTLGKFRHAISGLSEAVVDIILIGMNASLKAAHLGIKGNAFAVIANELKATADHVSSGASRLQPILDRIERSAKNLRERRIQGDPTQLAKLEPAILEALRQIEVGNDRLAGLMNRLVDEGLEFEGLMSAAEDLMTALAGPSAALHTVAVRLEAQGATADKVSANDEALLDEMFTQYKMERERVVHTEFLRSIGLSCKAAMGAHQDDNADDGVLLF